jgi:hypothetical protein
MTSSRCSYCKIEHRWHYRHAEYFDSIPPADWIENQ